MSASHLEQAKQHIDNAAKERHRNYLDLYLIWAIDEIIAHLEESQMPFKSGPPAIPG